ncbi:MAG: cytochrome c oxidase subunit 3 [Flavobacteriales bacterium]|nr:cytochrome c oxidase subunit 3 [Flavobacteriales bacterium]MBL4735942.1 cytochrome c oxidase subunit 3 [Flavobacteriales bacterium]PCH89732.1 MAG: cytochrome oxidase subunit III [Flavobacteriales bacterium]
MSTALISLEERSEIRSKTAKPLLWVGMMSMVMLFAAFTSAIVVRRAEPNWILFDLPPDLYISCFIIALSSLTLMYASRSAKNNNYQGVKIGVGATLILGIAFVISQFSGYGALVDAGMFFAGPTSNASWSFLYVVVGVHLGHLIGGLVVLMITLANAFKQRYNSNDSLGLQLTSIYWHFLDVLWIYLFLFLLLMI